MGFKFRILKIIFNLGLYVWKEGEWGGRGEGGVGDGGEGEGGTCSGVRGVLFEFVVKGKFGKLGKTGESRESEELGVLPSHSGVDW